MRPCYEVIPFLFPIFRRPARQRLRNPLGREVHLRQGYAAVEYFAVMRNQIVLEPDLGDAGEEYALALAARNFGDIGESVARIRQAAVAQGV